MKTSEDIADGEFLIPEPFNRLNDVYFKYVLGSPERKHITIDFLNAVLSHYVVEGENVPEIEDVEFLDREKNAQAEELKGARFDVYARSKDGRIFNIEVQNVKEKFFMKRSFYYAASDYTTQLERGTEYEKLEPVVFIGLMNFVLFGSYKHPEKWYSLYRFMNAETHEQALKEVEFHMIELPLLKRYLEKGAMEPNDKLEEILCYFGSIGGDELMEEIIDRNPTLSEIRFAESVFRKDPLALRNFLITERDRIDAEYRRKFELERAEKHGHARGFSKGRKEGRAEGQAEGLAEGREKGLAEGRAKGLAEGREKGLAEGIAQGLAEGQAQGLAEGREKGLAQGLSQGLAEGIAQGLTAGRQEEREAIARSLRSQGVLTPEQIAQALGLTLETVESL